MADNYKGGWEPFLAALEAQSAVSVIGICDYLLLDNYKKVMQFKGKGRLSNIDLLIPNLEFRVGPQADTPSGPNIHLLISPHDPNHVQEIERALGALYVMYNDRPYACTAQQLTELGHAYLSDTHSVSDVRARTEAVKQFKVGLETFRPWFENQRWLNRNAIVVGAATKDGFSGLKWESGWGATKEDIIRFCQAVFSGNPSDRKYFLGLTDGKFLARLGGPKPCFHGSDAHGLDNLLEPDLKRYCWIKAEPTFEGLRQTLLEPADRVWIGESPPIQHQRSKVLRSVSIRDKGGMFEELDLALNPGLIAVVGQKGTGKSALVEAIAFAAGGWSAFRSTTFIERAKQHLAGVTVDLEWLDGTRVQHNLNKPAPEEAKVRFLSQTFVERLCAEDYGSQELIKAIQNVVFEHLPSESRLNTSSFEELRLRVTGSILDERRRVVARISALNERENLLIENANTVSDKGKRLKALEEDEAQLQSELPQTGTDERSFADLLREKRDILSTQERQAALVQEKLLYVERVRQRIKELISDFAEIYASIRADVLAAEIDPTEADNFRPVFAGDVETPLVQAEAKLQSKLEEIVGRPASDEAVATGLLAIRSGISILEHQQVTNQARRAKTLEVQQRISEIAVQRSNLQSEIRHIAEVETAELSQLRQERIALYRRILESFEAEAGKLADLYGPLAADILQSAEEGRLEFFTRRIPNPALWMERCEVLFDQRKALTFGSIEALTEKAETQIIPALEDGNVEAAIAAIEMLQRELSPEKTIPTLRRNVSYRDLMNWLFSLDHLQLNYGLRYNGVELEKLSPGTKGVVLLMLYLKIDHSDSRPLIIDQPEENLDSASVYGLLKGYFRDAKKRRQIIIVTHNPNLVVNTDAEQVIVAGARREKGLPSFFYHAGALEDTQPPADGIREKLCLVVEGGAKAFAERERRYDLTRVTEGGFSYGVAHASV